MSDLISREAVLEFEEYVGEPATWDKPYPKGDLYVKSEIIERIPSAEPEPQWIPVTKQLPEQDQICLVCGKKGGVYVARFWTNGKTVLWTKTGTGKAKTRTEK